MSYQETVNRLAADAEQLERVYHEAEESGEGAEFQAAIEQRYAHAPDNLLYAAWFHRLNYQFNHALEKSRKVVIAWAWLIPLALVNGLLFWWLSDDVRFMIEVAGAPGEPPSYFAPVVMLLIGPISVMAMLLYLSAAGRRRWLWSLLISLLLLAAAGYGWWLYPQVGIKPFQFQYLALIAMHLPLLAWVGLGTFLSASSVTAPDSNPFQRFAFLTKSLELLIVGGLFGIAGGIFAAVTFSLFASLDVQIPELVARLIFAGGGGLLPVISLAVIYNPALPPAEQAFDEGVSKLIALLMRVLLPFTLVVLIVYLAFIPFNFWVPFDNREVLITYNAMLFAVVVLLVGATPLNLKEISPRLARWLRRGIIATAALALLVGAYALAAITWRTALDRLTPNRLAFIGWNVINIGLLVLLLVNQVRAKEGEWLRALFRTYRTGTVLYAGWTILVILAIPWLFGIDEAAVERLPPEVQKIVYEEPGPILLRCTGVPHIYVLDGSEKRWLEDIETLQNRGYVWDDVHRISCENLRTLPDGTPIPADAGPPPQV